MAKGLSAALPPTGGLRPFVDLRQFATSNLATSDDSAPANSPLAVSALDSSQDEYLPYVSGAFTTDSVSISGPSSLTATEVTDTAATISWNPASDNVYPIAGYNVEYRPDGSSAWISLGVTSSTSVSLTGLMPSTPYDVEADAVDSAGNTGNWSQATNLFSTASLPAPSLLSPGDLTTGQSTTPTFAWDAVTGAVGYNVIVDTSASNLPTNRIASAASTAVFSDHLTATSDTLTSPLRPDTTYYWEVQGTGNGGAGLWSGIGSFTTSGVAMTLLADGQVIQPGQTQASPNDGTDFGSAVRGTVPARQSFTIVNTGDERLTLGRLSVPQGFTVVTQPPKSLAAGDSATFRLRLNTTKFGTFAGVVRFPDNLSTAGENPFTFDVSGSVIPKPAPAITVLGDGQTIQPGRVPASSTNGTDLGSVRQGTPAVQATFTIENTGDAVLTLRRISVPVGFTLMAHPPPSIAPGGSGTFTIDLNTKKPGRFAGLVSLLDNDLQVRQNPFVFIVAGAVTPTAAGTG